MRNIISGNGKGITLDGGDVNGTIVEGNYIGAKRDGQGHSPAAAAASAS